jgi:tetratricopeptide (TPR) repeat protein
MMKDQIARALADKELARDARESKNLEEALTLIEAAAKQLDGLWEQNGESIDNAGPNASPDERDLVEALAETYGVKAGILRSIGQPEKAVGAYDRGLIFEQHPARKVDNSYNMVQGLTNRVLVAPNLVGAKEWKVLKRDMWEALENASSELQRQLRTSRANDPWAAADMIMVQILLAPRDPPKGERQVDDACSYCESLRPKPFVFESTLRTLNDFKDSLDTVPPDQRLETWNIVVRLLDIVTERFNEGFRKARAR